MLTLDGRDIVDATDGRDALVKALVRVPNLVITELDLPFVDGFSLCDILRRDPHTCDVPILVVTRYLESATIVRAERCGADVVLAKPLDAEAIRRATSQLLEQGRSFRARARAAIVKSAEERRLSAELLERLRERRTSARASYQAFKTTTPPVAALAIHCPSCGQPLRYDDSYVGGVSARHIEQWDYFTCPSGCGTFQYRQRTRSLRRV